MGMSWFGFWGGRLGLTPGLMYSKLWCTTELHLAQDFFFVKTSPLAVSLSSLRP
jgi:hypothetical protein